MQSQGIIKLHDAFYLGDQHSARDQEFMLLNHVTSVINCTNKYIPNYFQHYDIHYLDIDWSKLTDSIELCQEILQFVDETRERGESVMIHGLQDLDEAAALGAVCLMSRFRWSLFKTLQYIHSRIPELAFRAETFQVLKSYELTLLNQDTKLSYNWQNRPIDNEQLILRNTYLNCRDNCINKIGKYMKEDRKDKNQKKRVSWNFILDEHYVQHSKTNKQLQSYRSESQVNLKNQILLTVRKIMNQNIEKEKTALTKQKSGQSLKSSTTSDKHSPLSLKKYKSTYTLANIQSFERIQKADMLRMQIKSAQYPTQKMQQSVTTQQFNIQRVKTQNNQFNSREDQQIKQNVITEIDTQYSLQRDSPKLKRSDRNSSLSVKLLKLSKSVATNKQNDCKVMQRVTLRPSSKSKQ